MATGTLRTAAVEMRGVVAKLLFGIPVALVLALVMTIVFYEGRKEYWDWRVKRLCEKNGGVEIIEPVALTREQERLMPRINGHIGASPKAVASPQVPVFAESEPDFYIREQSPVVWRSKTNIVRRADGKVVATVVRHVRRGGDTPSAAHESYFICPDLQEESRLLSKLFIVEGEAK